MIAPAAAPMPALCARLGDRRDVRGAGVDCSTAGSRLGVISTSPAATVLAAVSAAAGAVVSPWRGACASVTRAALALDSRVLRVDVATGADRATAVALSTPRRVSAGCVRAARPARVAAAAGAN
jgi:hypothetical protein